MMASASRRSTKVWRLLRAGGAMVPLVCACSSSEPSAEISAKDAGVDASALTDVTDVDTMDGGAEAADVVDDGAPIVVGNPPSLWFADPLVKVFRDSTPPSPAIPAEVDAARGEYVSLQFAFNAPDDMQAISTKASTLTSTSGATLPAARLRFVGVIPITSAGANDAVGPDVEHAVPANFPDPLLEDPTLDVKGKDTQAAWITVEVPIDAEPGRYQARFELSGTRAGASFSISVPFYVDVFKATVPAERHLWIDNWVWSNSGLLKAYDPPIAPLSEDYWTLLKAWAKNLAEHRQNVILVQMGQFTTPSFTSDGTLQIDFSNFDRYVQTFIDAGVVGRITGDELSYQTEIDSTTHEVGYKTTIWVLDNGQTVYKSVRTDSPEADTYYSQYFPLLVKHLRDKGWFDNYLQHVGDETSPESVSTWLAAAGLVRKYAPGIKTIDAFLHPGDQLEQLDVAVQYLTHYLEGNYPARQAQGQEVWFYVAATSGPFCNRWVQHPLLHVRQAHWLNYSLGATGFLQWAWNDWPTAPDAGAPDPFHHPEVELAAGDSWIVYPKAGGVLDSIRYEAMRDGIEDYELLRQLAAKDSFNADNLVGRLGISSQTCHDYVSEFNDAHHELLQRLSE